MSGYSLYHILHECADDRNRVEVSKGRPVRDTDFYQSCWDTLNAWIESRLSRRQVIPDTVVKRIICLCSNYSLSSRVQQYLLLGISHGSFNTMETRHYADPYF